MNDKTTPETFTFSSYKVFKEPVTVDWFSKINVVIGKNNSGKSSLIDLVHALCDPNFMHSLELPKDALSIKTEWLVIHPEYSPLPDEDFNGDMFISTEINVTPLSYSFVYRDRKEADRNIKFGRYPRNTINPYKNRSFRKISSERDIVPEKAFEKRDDISFEFNGSNATCFVESIIDNDDRDDSLIKEKLLVALNEVMIPDSEYADIKVKRNDSEEWEIYLSEKNGKAYPLSRIGSGVKTVLLVLLNLLVLPEVQKNKLEYLYAFEELENNLYPALVKRLYRYILQFAKSSDSVFFLTTHSSSVIDLLTNEPEVSFYSVMKTENGSTVNRISKISDFVSVIDDLGQKASDLLQANGIIWVEGPSDRIYIKTWLEHFFPGKFIEGVHYQIMFYGGRLLSHVDAADSRETEQLINLLNINRHSYIVMDSDKSSDSDTLNETKKRIIRNMEETGNKFWVTAGREIENYLTRASGQYDRVSLNGKDKITFAKEHSRGINPYRWDLKERITELAAEIDKWNV